MANGNWLKPKMQELFENEPSWEKIMESVNEEMSSNQFILNGQLMQLSSIKETQELFRKAGFELKNRPKFGLRKEKQLDLITF